MVRPLFSRLFSRRNPIRRSSPPAARPRLSLLEDRLAPAVLDLSAAGVLSFTGANVANSLAFSLAAGNFNFADALDPITLGPGAIAAGYTVSGGGATAAGPAAGVNSIAFALGNAANTVSFGSFDSMIPSVSVSSAGIAGSSLTIASTLESTGAFSAAGFGSMTIAGELKGPAGISIAADNLDIQVPITSANNRTIVTTATTGRAINLGTETAGALSLTGLEMGRMSASVIQIGDAAAAGDITVSALIAPLNTNVLNLTNGTTRSVSQAGAGQISIPSLVVRSGTASITPTNMIGTFAARTQSDCTVVNQSPLIIGTVDGITGVTSVAGSVVIRSDQLDIAQSVAAATGFVVVTPRTPGRAVSLGGPDSPTELGLTDAELDFVTANVLSIGSSTTGGIAVVAAISQPAGYSTLSLTTGGAITSTALGTISVTNLSAIANNGINLPGLGVTNFAFANLVSGNVAATNSAALNLTAVIGAGTSRNDAGSISVTANGSLSILQDVIGLGTITLTTNDAAGAGQDLYLGLNHSITTTGAASDIVLRSGDNVLLDLGSIVRAGRAIAISINVGNADGAGATADARRAFIDAPSGGATITGAATDDTFIVSASPTTTIAVNGAGGFDTLQFDAAGRSVTITPTAILSGGTPALQPVTYSNIESLAFLNAAGIVIPGTAGDDTFALVRVAGGIQVTLNGGLPILVGELPVTLDGLTGTNTVVLDFAGGSPIPTGGISFVNISRYIVRGTGAADTVDLQRAGTIQFQFNGGLFINLPGAAYFEFDGLAGSDALRVHYAGGDPVPANGVVFDGGTGANDRLGVFGVGNAATYSPSATTPGDGTVAVDLGTITFRNLTPVDITGMTNVAVVFPNADDVVALNNGFDFTNGGATPAIRISGTSGGVAIETLALWNNTNVVIDTRTSDGNDAVTINSATVGGNTNLAILTGVGTDVVTVAAGGVLLTGQFTIASQAINVNGPVTSTAGGVTFTNGGTLTVGAVTVSAQGAIAQNGAGSVNIAGSAIFSSAGTISLQSAVQLNAGVTATFISIGEGILFNSTINGAGNVICNTAGLTTFNGAVGGIQPLASVTTDAAGATLINGGLVATTGDQTFNDPVTLTADTTLNGVNVTFGQTLDSDGFARSLLVNASGVTTFLGLVGSLAPLGSLTTNVAGSTDINGGMVTTNGDQIYNDAVTLSANATINAANITFAQTVNSDGTARALTLNSGGLTTLNGAVGGLSALASLTTDPFGTTAINGGLVRTTGLQEYFDAVTVGAAVTQFTSTGAGRITFRNSLTGAANVSVNTAGLTEFLGAVSLTSLTTDAAGTTDLNGGSVITTGNQNYNDLVVLTANTTLNGANVTFAQTVNSDGTARSLRVTSPGVTTFGGAVGGLAALASLTTNGGGTTAVNGGLVRTTGFQDYVNAVTVAAGATQFASTGNGAITFHGSLTGPSNVTINTGGLTEFLAPVSLTSLTTDAAGTTDLNGLMVTTTGNQNYNDPVVLTSDMTITAANITFAQTVNSDNTPRSLLVTSPGVTTFGGAVGGSSPLAFLTSNGGGTTAVNGGLVRTTGDQNYVNAVTIPAGATQFVSLNNGAIFFNNALTGPGNVAINTGGITEFLGAVSLASLTTDAPGTTDLNGGTVTTTGDQIYNDPVILTANTIINAANVTFMQTVDSDGTPRTLLVNSPGFTVFGGAVGQSSPLAALTTDMPGATLIYGGFITTVGPQTFNDAVGMPAGMTTFTANGAAGDITFNGPTSSLGAVLIANARNVTINNGFSAATLLQTTGSGSTVFNGPTAITGVPAIDITNTAISLNNDVNVTGSGATVRFNATVNGVTQAAGALLVGVGAPPVGPGNTVEGRNGVLLLTGAGSFTLNRPNNDVGLITANIVGALNFLDSNDLSIATAGIQTGIRTNGGAVTLTTGRNFRADDPNILAPNPPPLINAGAGIVQVNPGQIFGAVISFNSEVIAGSVTLGTVIVPAQMFNNAQPDQFFVRPSANVEIVVQGNRPSVIVPPIDLVNRDALSPIFAGITVPAVFTPNGTSAGIYTFPDAASPTGFQRKALRFFEIEQLVGFSATTIAFQTSASTFTVATRVQQLGQVIQTATTQGQPQPNPFVVSPGLTDPFQPFGASRVTYGDVNGDGAADLIIGGGPNGPPLVTVIDGNRLAAGGNINLNDPTVFLAQFYAYNPQFTGGIFVAAGDINGDGKAEIVTAPDIGGAPHVRILSVVFSPGQPGFGGGVTIYNNVTNYTPAPGGLPAEFFAYDPSFTGGVRVAVGDVDGDSKADVVTGAGVGGAPHVKVFSGATGQTIRSFFAYDPGFTGGIFVAAGQFNGDGLADILTGPGIGGGPHIKVFSGANPNVLLANFLVPASLAAPPPSLSNPNPLLGVGSVSFSFIDSDNNLDIVVGTSRGTQSRVLFFRADGSQINLVQPFIIPNVLTDGVNVAGSGS